MAIPPSSSILFHRPRPRPPNSRFPFTSSNPVPRALLYCYATSPFKPPQYTTTYLSLPNSPLPAPPPFFSPLPAITHSSTSTLISRLLIGSPTATPVHRHRRLCPLSPPFLSGNPLRCSSTFHSYAAPLCIFTIPAPCTSGARIITAAQAPPL
ncbi:hypothetical protein M0R45_006183 [Rubus argutus]|uniref:Uncharacterized protein n=1 Tax=Rubus argutus TaxID=59490 RepID=A0AAW1YQB0_RUBAR